MDQTNIFVKKIIQSECNWFQMISSTNMLVRSIWNQFHSDWIKMLYAIWYGIFIQSEWNWFQMDQTNFLDKILVWSIWNQFHSDWIKMPSYAMLKKLQFQMAYSIFIQSEWHSFQMDQNNFFNKNIGLVQFHLDNWSLPMLLGVVCWMFIYSKWDIVTNYFIDSTSMIIWFGDPFGSYVV